MVLLWFWVVRVKKKKTRLSSRFQGKVNFFENLILATFMTVIDILKNGRYSSNKFSKYLRSEIIFFKVKEKVQTFMLKLELAK